MYSVPKSRRLPTAAIFSKSRDPQISGQERLKTSMYLVPFFSKNSV